MNSVIQSVLTSIAMNLAVSITTWAIAKGIVPASDASNVENYLVAAISLGVAAALGWWKARRATKAAMIATLGQPAMIKAVNDAPNGVKVVAASSMAVKVDAPIVIPSKGI